MTTLKEFDTRLGYHDWYYPMSDDHSVYCHGRDNATELEYVAKTSPEHRDLMTAWTKFHFTGDSFKTEKFTREMLNEVRKRLNIFT
jgi:hypothetical protein